MAFAAEVAVWWALLCGLWLITLSSLSTGEELVAAGCALVAAVAAAGARRAMEGAWRPTVRWVAWAGPVLVAIPVDTVRVLGLAARRVIRPHTAVGDEVVRVRLPHRERTAVGAARGALGTFAVSVTPGTVVVDWDQDRGELVVHRLVRGSPSLEQVVAR